MKHIRNTSVNSVAHWRVSYCYGWCYIP